MEKIFIDDENSNTIIYFNNKKYCGYTFYKDNSIKSVESISDLIDFLTISPNYSVLESNKNSTIILDNNTNLKHYIINNNIDLVKFYLNNGEDALLYNKVDDIKDKLRKFKIGTKQIVLTFSALALLYGNSKLDASVLKVSKAQDLTPTTLEEMIKGSTGLTEEEKEYLINEDYFNDVLKYINTSEIAKYRYYSRFNNITIKSYDNNDNSVGYYNRNDSNVINMKKYEGLNDNNKDYVAHEFMHLCQGSISHNLILEASAEIMSYEYYDQTSINAYFTEVKLLKKLMEVIGPEPILKFDLLGYFDDVEVEVKKYLTDDEYKMFVRSLNTKDHYEKIVDKYSTLNKLIEKMYYLKYNKDIKEDDIIYLIDSNNDTLVRYYFNPRYINEENSYYINDNGLLKAGAFTNDNMLETIYIPPISQRDNQNVLTK